MGFRNAIRNWANKPTKVERLEIKHKQELLELQKAEEEQRKRDILAEASKESAQVRALKKQLDVMEELLEKAYTQIKEQSSIIANHKEGDWMDKLVDKGLDVVDNVFGSSKNTIDITPKKKKSTPSPSAEITESTTTASEESQPAEGYSSQEVKDFVDNMEDYKIKIASNFTYDKFSNIIKKNAPEATNENILEAYELVKERANNGKE